jgi:DNA-binding GntR family transcriptional regulator
MARGLTSDTPTTLVEQVCADIRADILAGRRRPGTRLVLSPLVEEYRTSMGVVREALSRLVSQGLVVVEAQHGFRVTPISLADLEHLTEARCRIEVLVFREAILNGGLDWESRLVAAHHTMARTPQVLADDPDRFDENWILAHSAFHEALLAGCDNPRLVAAALTLRDAAELYRRWSMPLGKDQDRDVAGEHRQLLEAAISRSVDDGARLLEEHIRRTSRVLVENFE